MSKSRYQSLCERIEAMDNWKAAALCAVCASKVTPIIARLGLPNTWRLVEKCLDYVWHGIAQPSDGSDAKRMVESLEATPEWNVEDNSFLPDAVTQVLDFIKLALLAVATPELAKENATGAFDLLIGVTSGYDFSAKKFPAYDTKPGPAVALERSEGESQERLVTLLEKESTLSNQTILALRREAERIAAMFKAILPMYCYDFLKG
jgi:hypothetical protein